MKTGRGFARALILCGACAVTAVTAPVAFGAENGGCSPDCPSTIPGVSCANSTVCGRPGIYGWDSCHVLQTCGPYYYYENCVNPGNVPCGGQAQSHSAICNCACTYSAPACPVSGAPSWQPYGFIQPGDPLYDFGKNCSSFVNGAWANCSDPADLVGLSAKGNIVIGDYTNASFISRTLPKLDPNTGYTQQYAIDPTDAELGYLTSGYDSQGRPLFNGVYNAQDKAQGTGGTAPGLKLDGAPRKFYESTLTDLTWKGLDAYGRPLVDPKISAPTVNPNAMLTVNAVLFTNHALAGFVNATYLDIHGAFVARDDGLIFGKHWIVSHDQRLMNAGTISSMMLPMGIQKLKLKSMKQKP